MLSRRLRVLSAYFGAFALAFCVFSLPETAIAAATSNASSSTIDLPSLDAPPSMDGTIDDSWSAGAHVTLPTDYTNRRPSLEKTDVTVARDGDAIDLAFAVQQKGGRIASQQTNGSSVLSDDYVGVYFWPQATHGFQYEFFANPRGARYQISSENSSYSPQWTAVAKQTPQGYTVTMRIPLTLIRSGGSTTWKVQFVRQDVSTNSLDVWTYSAAQNNLADPVYAGTVTGVLGKTVASRPKPRAQIYALGEATTKAEGGSTSRLGADFSLPVTPTSSLVASVHPDYSNVEVDQQTIAPSPFAYQYAEVRPFFTQAAQSFDQTFSCSNCPTLLYTPSIPTYRDGYAYEGTQGPFSFAAFDTVGQSRNDGAQVFSYSQQNAQDVYQVAVQHTGVDARADAGDLHDETTSITSGFLDRHTHYYYYANGAIDRGSAVTSPGDANYLETGAGYITPLLGYGANYQQIGEQFEPADGFVQQSDITGYESYYHQTFNFSSGDFLHDITTSANGAEYHNHLGLRAQEYASSAVDFDFRNLATIRLNQSESAVRIENGEFLPYDGNGALVGYRYATNTPTYVQFGGGPYYHGKLDSWSYVSTVGLAPTVHLRLESDEDKYFTRYPGETDTSYWLDRASLDWQVNRFASFDVGARRLVGTPLPGSFGLVGGPALGAGNLTAAFHLLEQKNEFYFVYGDPNSLSTKPALYLKWIRYIGAPKGT